MTLQEMEAILKNDPRYLAWQSGSYVSPRHPEAGPVPYNLRGQLTFANDNPDLMPEGERWSIDTKGEDAGSFNKGMSNTATALSAAAAFGGPLAASYLPGVGAAGAAGDMGATYGPTLEQLGASQGGGIGSWLASHRNWLAPAIGAGVGLLGRAVTPQRNTQVPIPPQLQQLLEEATRRQMNQGPLADAVTRQAMAGLPNYAKG